MAVKKPQPKKTTKTQTPPPPRQKVNLEALANRAMALREQHAAKPAAPPTAKPTKAVRYLVEYDDGSVLYAEGGLADVIYRYTQECEQICCTKGLAYYDGPALTRISREEMLKKLGLPSTQSPV